MKKEKSGDFSKTMPRQLKVPFRAALWELISLLGILENKGLPDGGKNKSPAKQTKIQGFRHLHMVRIEKCD